jgi:hypothetical protein
MRNVILVLIVQIFVAWAFVSKAASSHPVFEKIKVGKESYYSPRLPQLLNQWPPKIFPSDLKSKGSAPINIVGIKTPGLDNYIGIAKQFVIDAPLKIVAGIMDDFEHYKDRNPDLVDVKVKMKNGDQWITHWEVKSPAFFIPNSRYEQIYIMDRTFPNKVIYRYQLKEGNNLNYSDGLVVLEPVGKKTRITSFDFFDAKWGFLGSVAMGKIWHETIEGYYKGDLALKLQIENPEWKYEQIDDARKRILETFPTDPIYFLENPLFKE